MVVLPLAFGAGMLVFLVIGDRAFQFRPFPDAYAVVPFIGLGIGLALHLLARERERYRGQALHRSPDLAALRRLSWSEFEIVVGEIVRRRHPRYTVKERGGFHADGGVDLIAEGPQGRIAIQCKHWRAWHVGAPRVRELYGVVKAGGFKEGWLVTSGSFTRDARGWAAGKELRLIDGPQLARLAAGIPEQGQASEPPAGPACPNCGVTLRHRYNPADKTDFWACPNGPCGWTFNDPPASPDSVTCDRGHRMVVRPTRLGHGFWGCSAYPACQRKRLLAAEPVSPGTRT